MKFTSKQLLLVTFIIGIALIIFAVVCATVNVGLDAKLVGDISTYGMMGGLVVLVLSRKRRSEEEAAAKAASEQTVEKTSEQDTEAEK